MSTATEIYLIAPNCVEPIVGLRPRPLELRCSFYIGQIRWACASFTRPTNWCCRYDLGRQRSKRGVVEEKWMFKQLLDVLEKNRFSLLTCSFGCFFCSNSISSDFIERVWEATFPVWWPHWCIFDQFLLTSIEVGSITIGNLGYVTDLGWDDLGHSYRLGRSHRRKHHVEATTETWPGQRKRAGENRRVAGVIWDGTGISSCKILHVINSAILGWLTFLGR